MNAARFTVGLALALALAPQGAGATERLSQETWVRLERGEQIVKTQDMPGSSWPAVTVFQLTDATPEEAMAVFTDFGSQASYLGECCGVRRSVVVDPAVGGDPKVQRVSYELEVPVVSNERYELIETTWKGPGDTYWTSWRKSSKGGHSDEIVGTASVEPHDSGALFRYYSYVKMSSFGSGLFAGRATERTTKTVDAMVHRMNQMHGSRSPELEADLARLRAALEG